MTDIERINRELAQTTSDLRAIADLNQRLVRQMEIREHARRPADDSKVRMTQEQLCR